MHVENIVLKPHPMDAWSNALDVLIACAPGSEEEIRAFLGAAMRQLHVAGRKTRLPNLQVRFAGRLITACGIDADSLLEADLQRRPAGEVRHAQAR